MQKMDSVRKVKTLFDAIVGIHAKFERGTITKTQLTDDVLEINRDAEKELQQIQKELQKNQDIVKKKDAKIKELAKYNSNLSDSLSKCKKQNTDLEKRVDVLNTSVDELFGELDMDNAPTTSTPKKCAGTEAGPSDPKRMKIGLAHETNEDEEKKD